ncbi:MAG: FAD-binding oxidoreductase [Candidatus Thorarchaeota archaeon]
MNSDIVDKLTTIVGIENISTREDVLLTYASSASMAKMPIKPGAVIRPKNVDEVKEILRIANAYKINVTVRSGGTSLQGEVIPHPDGLVIEMLRFNEITLFEDLRSVRVGAGVTYGELDKFLSQHGLWVPVTPESALGCTIAGNTAVNGAGPGSSLFGCTGDLILGLEVVLPISEVIQTGTEASPYAPGPFLRYAFGVDLTGLFIGSLGSLGVITSVSLKVFKRMEYFYYNTYGFETHEAAERFLIELKNWDVNAVFASIYEGPVLELFMEMLGDEYGIPPMEWPHRTVSMTIGRTREDMMQSDAVKANELCEELGGKILGIEELPKGEWDGRLWTFVRACYAHGWHWRTLYHHQTPMNSHRSVEEISKVMDKYGFLGHTAGFLTDHSSTNMYPHLYFDPVDSEDERKIVDAHDELAVTLFKTGAVPFKLAPFWKDKMDGTETYMALLEKLKNAIDPNDIMNKGVLGGI